VAYEVEISGSASSFILKLSKKDRARVEEKIESLATDPRPHGSTKLKQSKDKGALYRIRSGNYRIVYAIKDDILLVLVTEVGHRKEIYRDL